MPYDPDKDQYSHHGTSGAYDTSAFEGKQRKHVEYQPVGVRARRRQARSAKMHSGLKPMRFVSLHHHSTFSFLDGFEMPEAHVRRATEIQMGSLAMTEHGNVFSHVRLEKAASEMGVHPIFGCEFYVGWTDEKRHTQKKNHLTVLAKDAQGYRNLMTLVSRSWSEGFYYEPTVDWNWLVEHQKGLVILSGCQGSTLFTATVGGKHVAEEDAGYRRGLRVARWMAKRFEDFYVEVQAFPELDKTRQANPLLARIAQAINRPLVATMDCHYTAPEGAEIQQILHNVRPGENRDLKDQIEEWGYSVPLCPPATDKSIYRRLVATGLTKSQALEAIVSTEEIAQSCKVTLPKLPHVEFPLPSGYATAKDLWRDWLKEGWRYRECNKLPARERDRYKEQLAKEMEVIEAKEYLGYFLIVSDAIKMAKDTGIPVGPARGSAAASLACWLLRITEVNPMMFDNLVFERFIDWSREDMPDIDVDFAGYGRPIVRRYLEQKYPDVNNVGTFIFYKSKNALDDVARVYKIPKVKVDILKDVLVERSSGDLRASATIEDTVDQFDAAFDVVKEYPRLQMAMDLEGNVKGFGVHAAGLVISNGPITDVAAVLEREVKEQPISVVSMDKYDCERQGLEKLDFLGLNTMDMIHEALNTTGLTLEDLYAIPLDDEATIEGFRRNDVVGVFQFDGRATRIVCGALKPDDFHEVVCVNALSRPGPLHNGAVQGYVGSKWNEESPDRIHPALDKITEPTQYQIIFQEQILRIVRDIGDFSWTHAAYIRKIISRKLGDAEFNRQWKTFLKGALSVHERQPDVPAMDAETAKRIWGMCITAGSYAFNAAHSTAYSMIAFWTMWLKQHHTTAFYAASLQHTSIKSEGRGYENTSRSSRANDLIMDAVKGSGPREPIAVMPTDVYSGPTWAVQENGVIKAGFEQIPGIGKKMSQKIADEHLTTWPDLLAVPGIGQKTLDKIVAFSEQRDPFDVYTLREVLEATRTTLNNGVESLPKPSHTATEIFESDGGVKVTFLGQPMHRNLRDMFEANRAKTGEALDPKDVKNPEFSQWMVLLARDDGELASFVIPRYKYPQFKEALWKMKLGTYDELVLIEGKKGAMRGTLGSRSGIVFVNKIWVLEPDKEEA